MQIENSTTFPLFIFESVDENDTPIHVVILRGTYAIVDNNSQLAISEVQDEIVLADVYRGTPMDSSVRIEADIVPRKLSSDITFNSTAFAPGGKPTSQWKVAVSVGKVTKNLWVCGQRHWRHNIFAGWQISEPVPVKEVPIHFELAYGGKAQFGNELRSFQKNPVGIGFFNPSQTPLTTLVPAPQIWDEAEPIIRNDFDYSPVGLGPIAKHWVPRIKLCGTADEEWQKKRWPLRPSDFDFRYYNSAPAGLAYSGFLIGDEAIVLKGIGRDRDYEFSLPGVFPLAIRSGNVDAYEVKRMTLDTMHCDTVNQSVALTWRATFLKKRGTPRVSVSMHSLLEKRFNVTLG